MSSFMRAMFVPPKTPRLVEKFFEVAPLYEEALEGLSNPALRLAMNSMYLNLRRVYERTSESGFLKSAERAERSLEDMKKNRPEDYRRWISSQREMANGMVRRLRDEGMTWYIALDPEDVVWLYDYADDHRIDMRTLLNILKDRAQQRKLLFLLPPEERTDMLNEILEERGVIRR